MNRILIAAATALALCACHSTVDDFRQGIPTQPMTQINVPGYGSSGSNLEAAGVRQAAQNQTSGFYVLTRGATLIVNGGVGAWLGLLKTIVNNPPTSANGNVMVWGPWTDALSANTWRLTVTKTGNNQYAYVLDGKAKTAADSTYVTVVSGNHTVTGQDFGSGSFTVSWDNADTLPEHDGNTGQASVSYSRDINTKVVTVDVTFTNAKDANSGQAFTAEYSYTSSPGTFQFATLINGTRWTVESRWLQSGAGRAGGKATVNATAYTANECWDSNFLSQYQHLSYDSSAANNYGVEATSCAIVGAEYSNLP